MIRADYLSAVAVLGVAAYLGLPFVRGTGRPGQGGYQLRLADLGARTALGGLLWTWAGDGTAQAYLAGYLIEKSLSVDNIVLFAAIFSGFAIPARYQHRVLMIGIIGALVMRAAFIAAGITLLEAIHPVIYVFGAVLLVAAVKMLRSGTQAAPAPPRRRRVLRRQLYARIDADRMFTFHMSQDTTSAPGVS